MRASAKNILSLYEETCLDLKMLLDFFIDNKKKYQ